MAPDLSEYLKANASPAPRPSRDLFSAETRDLHDRVDAAIRRTGVPYLHPQNPTLQLDMLGSRHMSDWQEKKVEITFDGERCWSDLHQFYGRYGVEAARPLLGKMRDLEAASGVILTDCGMQSIALTLDILARPGGHAILMRGVYNKTRRYLEWLGLRMKIETTIVDEGDLRQVEEAIRETTFVVLGETYNNPATRALDPEALGQLVLEARKTRARHLTSVIDNTIASPCGVRKPLLEYAGIDFIAASGTKALAGQDRDLWGYIATRRIDFLNEAMDLQAMRGGALDWRRAEALVAGLDEAERNFRRRCETATHLADYLGRHPAVESVHHPSRADHPDRAIIDAHYRLPGSLMSFRIDGADENASRHFADVLASCEILRYAGSFDGLTTKVNHHRTVSEYFTPEEELQRANIDRMIRLGVGLEAPEDLEACLNWALCHYRDISEEDVVAWQTAREKDLGIREER